MQIGPRQVSGWAYSSVTGVLERRDRGTQGDRGHMLVTQRVPQVQTRSTGNYGPPGSWERQGGCSPEPLGEPSPATPSLGTSDPQN